MIKVYFETPNNSLAELVAIVDTEEIYHTILPALEELARRSNMIVTESVDGLIDLEDLDSKYL